MKLIKPIALSALFFFALMQAQAQSLYMPRDIQKAFNKETRQADGTPGKKYWQNHGTYNITITALPPDRNIKGSETIVYENNSPDTLKRLNMKLILNIHKPGAARFGDAGADYLTTGIHFDKFLVNGDAAKINGEGASTNMGVTLAKPLAPHQSVKLDIDWHFEISLQSGREGMIDPTTYYLAYFYPRVSVYDDYNGWDRLPFLDAQEFYNDFNDYTLTVNAPKNYIVWATGTLQNPKAVLQPEYAKRLEKSMTSDSTIHIATAADIAKKNITAQKDQNSWIWKADDISDMAVGISDHYVWDGASTIVDDATHRRASMQAAFQDSAADFHHAVQAGRHSLSWLSHNWPGVPYPFPKMTAFQGFADMEYPMMVNDSHTDDIQFAAFVQDHEIAHTYFPFYMGINESRYAFMDEGWATTFERLIGTDEVGAEKADALYKDFRINGWIHDAVTAEDQPIITMSSELRAGYGNNSYGKPSLSYFALKDMLGDDLFKKALHGYMDRWHGKHPIPWDYFNSMTNLSGRNLDWFFNNWFFSNYYIDLDLQNVGKTNGGYTADIKNVGGFAVPFDVKITYTDGTTETQHQTPAVWEHNQKQIAVNIKTNKTIKAVTLDGNIFMDATPINNTYTIK
ncbi:M1 family metallopeptidase [Mucilaginibacter sp. FT3.2]|uniref:M1 family metallopeptidase n=1 Tax=Mucilaginibacter sp. FT3.2 TaxID=2723090 RepID=UPI001609BC2B|nr:M1 family metallopeptidase [Mucilaginibacter sp. FT3.2]MBB6232058.1 hypothetical protein [Mucilaginibacter sp. FT3.2]